MNFEDVVKSKSQLKKTSTEQLSNESIELK